MNNTNVEYMKEYLKFAMEMEKYVYIWNNALSDVNQKIASTERERYRINENLLNARATYEKNYNKNSVKKVKSVESIDHYKSKKKSTLITLIIDLIICTIIGIVAYLIISNFQPIFESILISVYISVMLFLFTVIGPMSLITHIIACAQYKRYTKIVNDDVIQTTIDVNSEIMESIENETRQAMIVCDDKESALRENRETIYIELETANKNLRAIYSENVLPEIYRNFSAVSTLYQYLYTGRCTAITGHGGIYDTYEYDLKLGIIIGNLMEINSRLSDIQRNQRLLYDSIQEANSTLSSINSQLTDIERSNREIANNTAISATANQQTAEVARWMRWKMN